MLVLPMGVPPASEEKALASAAEMAALCPREEDMLLPVFEIS